MKIYILILSIIVSLLTIKLKNIKNKQNQKFYFFNNSTLFIALTLLILTYLSDINNYFHYLTLCDEYVINNIIVEPADF